MKAVLFLFFSILLVVGSQADNCPSFQSGDIRWSSSYNNIPAGATLDVPAGQTVWFDYEMTNVITRLNIEGTVVFDPPASGNLVLKANEIFINAGGTLRIGCSSAPFTRQAEIILFGQLNANSAVNPGSKIIFVGPGGTLELS